MSSIGENEVMNGNTIEEFKSGCVIDIVIYFYDTLPVIA